MLDTPHETDGSHTAFADLAIQLAAEIIHTISLVHKTSDLVGMLWYPAKQFLLTAVGIIFSVVLNLGPDSEFAVACKADLRVALQILKEFSAKSAGSKKNFRDVQFLRHLCNQALRSKKEALIPITAVGSPTTQSIPEILPSADGECLDTYFQMPESDLLLSLLENGDRDLLHTSAEFDLMGYKSDTGASDLHWQPLFA